MPDPKIVLITGAGSGVGRATALEFLSHGHTVALVGRQVQTLEETAALANGGTPLVLPCDVADENSVIKSFETVKNEYGRLDVLFNNAGAALLYTLIDEITLDQWKTVIEVNVNGAFLCAREAFKMMRNQSPVGGRIINNGSISAQVPRPGSAAYTSSKHAITGLTKSVSLDGRPYDIACGQIDIGNAATAITENMPKGVPQADGSVAPEPVMDTKLVAEAVYHMAMLPLDTNVPFMTIMANKMPFIGRG